MTSGKCPKCGSEEIYSNKQVSEIAKRYSGPTFSFWGRKRAIDTYVCCVCGFVEHYVVKGPELESIKSKGFKQGPGSKD
jgi:hypothetical protein